MNLSNWDLYYNGNQIESLFLHPRHISTNTQTVTCEKWSDIILKQVEKLLLLSNNTILLGWSLETKILDPNILIIVMFFTLQFWFEVLFVCIFFSPFFFLQFLLFYEHSANGFFELFSLIIRSKHVLLFPISVFNIYDLCDSDCPSVSSLFLFFH